MRNTWLFMSKDGDCRVEGHAPDGGLLWLSPSIQLERKKNFSGKWQIDSAIFLTMSQTLCSNKWAEVDTRIILNFIQ